MARAKNNAVSASSKRKIEHYTHEKKKRLNNPRGAGDSRNRSRRGEEDLPVRSTDGPSTSPSRSASVSHTDLGGKEGTYLI